MRWDHTLHLNPFTVSDAQRPDWVLAGGHAELLLSLLPDWHLWQHLQAYQLPNLCQHQPGLPLERKSAVLGYTCLEGNQRYAGGGERGPLEASHLAEIIVTIPMAGPIPYVLYFRMLARICSSVCFGCLLPKSLELFMCLFMSTFWLSCCLCVDTCVDYNYFGRRLVSDD